MSGPLKGRGGAPEDTPTPPPANRATPTPTPANTPPPPSFRTGGPLDQGDVYIVRPADAELFNLLSRGDYAYVVGPTQLGKTNLALRAIERLRRDGHPSAPKGFRCALVDLSDVGYTEDAHAWFRGLVRVVRENL